MPSIREIIIISGLALDMKSCEIKDRSWCFGVLFGFSVVVAAVFVSQTDLMYLPELFHTFTVTHAANGAGVCFRQRAHLSPCVSYCCSVLFDTLQIFSSHRWAGGGGGGDCGCQRFTSPHHHVLTCSEKQLQQCEQKQIPLLVLFVLMSFSQQPVNLIQSATCKDQDMFTICYLSLFVIYFCLWKLSRDGCEDCLLVRSVTFSL